MHLKKINYFILHGEIKLSLAARQTSLAARQIVVLFSGTQTVLTVINNHNPLNSIVQQPECQKLNVHAQAVAQISELSCFQA